MSVWSRVQMTSPHALHTVGISGTAGKGVESKPERVSDDSPRPHPLPSSAGRPQARSLGTPANIQ